jgi:branched-chain amino acid transport system permease protein
LSELSSQLVVGIVFGAVFAVSASGLVVTYNTTGIFNFAHGAMGMLMAYLFWQLWQGWGLPAWLALVLVLLVAAPLLGMIVERVVMRPLYGASTNVALVVSLGLLLMLVGVASSIWKSSNSYNLPEFWSGSHVDVAGVNFSYEQLVAVGLALVVAVGLRALFKLTRPGVAMRAVVDDPELAQLNGAPSGRIAAYAWMIGAALAAVAGILQAAVSSTMNITQLTQLVIYGFVAAVVGRMRSLPLTFVGAMILGISYSLSIAYVPASLVTYVTEALPMTLLFLALITMPQARLSVGRMVRPRPPRSARTATTLYGAVGLVLAVAVLSRVLSGANLATLGEAMVFGLLGLSLIPLAGYGGQISLCQLSFAGLGALAAHWAGGGSSFLSWLAAFGLCGGAGALLCLPTLRLRGLYLALATLAFAVLMDNACFTSPSVIGSAGAVPVARPHVGGIGFASDRSFVVLAAVVVAIGLVGVGALRRSAFGRRLVAMNDSPAACATVGLNLRVTKLAVFALSSAMAGLAGAIYGGLTGTAIPANFGFLISIVLFVAVTLQGATLLSSAVLAGIGLALAPVIGAHLSALSNFTDLAFGIGIITIGRQPNGATGLLSDQWAYLRRRWGHGAQKADQGSGPARSGDTGARTQPPPPRGSGEMASLA